MIGGVDSSINFSAGIGYPTVRRVPIPVQYVPIPSSSYGAYGGGGPQVVCVRPSNSSSLFNLDNLLDLAGKGVQLLVLVGGAWFGVKWLGNHEKGEKPLASLTKTAVEAYHEITDLIGGLSQTAKKAKESILDSDVNGLDLAGIKAGLLDKLKPALNRPSDERQLTEAVVGNSEVLTEKIEELGLTYLSKAQISNLKQYFKDEDNKGNHHLLLLLPLKGTNEEKDSHTAIIISPSEKLGIEDQYKQLGYASSPLRAWSQEVSEAIQTLKDASDKPQLPKKFSLEEVNSLADKLSTHASSADIKLQVTPFDNKLTRTNNEPTVINIIEDEMS